MFKSHDWELKLVDWYQSMCGKHYEVCWW